MFFSIATIAKPGKDEKQDIIVSINEMKFKTTLSKIVDKGWREYRSENENGYVYESQDEVILTKLSFEETSTQN